MLAHARDLLRLVGRPGYLESSIPGALRRGIDIARAHVLLRHCQTAHTVRATGYVQVAVAKLGQVRIGDRAMLLGGMVPTEIVCHPGGLVEIGEDSLLNYAVAIEATRGVRIGRRCMLASFVVLNDRTASGQGPIVLDDNVWVAHGAVIAPGVTVGHGSVVSARAVVTRDVPPGSLAIGNPARCMSLDLVASSRTG